MIIALYLTAIMAASARPILHRKYSFPPRELGGLRLRFWLGDGLHAGVGAVSPSPGDPIAIPTRGIAPNNPSIVISFKDNYAGDNLEKARKKLVVDDSDRAVQCSREGKVVVLTCPAVNHGPGTYYRTYLWREGDFQAIPITGFVPSADQRLPNSEAIHLSKNGNDVWIARLGSGMIYLAKIDVRNRRWTRYPSVPIGSKCRQLPPYVFIESSHGEYILTGQKWGLMKNNSDPIQWLPGPCPFQYFPNLGITVYRELHGDGLANFGIVTGSTVRNFSILADKMVFPPGYNQAYVDKKLLIITQFGQSRIFSLPRLKAVPAIPDTEIVLNGIGFDFGGATRLAGSAREWSIQFARVGKAHARSKDYSFDQNQLLYADLMVFGTSAGAFQDILSYSHEGLFVDYSSDLILAPADWRQRQVPIQGKTFFRGPH